MLILDLQPLNFLLTPVDCLLLGLLAASIWFLVERWRRAIGRVKRHLSMVETISRTAAQIAAIRGDSQFTLNELVQSARETLQVDMCGILLRNGSMVDVVAFQSVLPRIGKTSYKAEEAVLAGCCIDRRQIIAIPDADMESESARACLAAWGIRSAVYAPLIVDDQAIGCLVLAGDRPRRLDPVDLRLAASLSHQVSVILASKRLLDEREQALASRQKLMEQREALHQLTGQIYRSQNLEATLQRLADAAPRIIGVDICLIDLLTGRPNEIKIVAVTGGGELLHSLFNTAGSNMEKAFSTGLPVIVEDARVNPSVNPQFRKLLDVGSTIYFPLRGNGPEPIGILQVIRHAEGAFTQDQLHLVQVFAAQAAAAIETARLYAAEKQLSASQNILLRELNHRVKNNLASIVALLTVNRPDMPGSVELWLNRATERISTMARTHELFVSGKDSVTLADLVTRLLPALSVITPSDVEILTDLADAQVSLDTEQAVSVAMVLNELCWNALEHGLQSGGSLLVRAARSSESSLIVEVRDQRRSGDASAHLSGRFQSTPGFGLRLVEGIVERELRGRFNIASMPGGPTVARVELPLNLFRSSVHLAKAVSA